MSRKISYILFIIVYVVMLYLTTLGVIMAGSDSYGAPDARTLLLSGGYFCGFLAAAVVNVLWISPVLMRGRKIAYLVYTAAEVLAVSVVGVLCLSGVTSEGAPGWMAIWWVSAINVLSSLVLVSLVMMAVTAFALMTYGEMERKRLDEVKRLSRATELAALERQLSPHFIFNMLNNAITLVRISPTEGRRFVTSLKSLLHYQIEECKGGEVTLSNEVTHLQNFLQLEKARHDDMDVRFSVDGDLSGVTIPSLLFFPVVENAVKHNLPEYPVRPFVDVTVGVSGDILHFRCANSRGEATGAKGGLGIANMRRRLELAYPSRHRVTITDTPDTYTMDITIKVR